MKIPEFGPNFRMLFELEDSGRHVLTSVFLAPPGLGNMQDIRELLLTKTVRYHKKNIIPTWKKHAGN